MASHGGPHGGQPPPKSWLDLAAGLDEHGDLVAVRIRPGLSIGRNAHGAERRLKSLDAAEIAALLDFLDSCSLAADGPRQDYAPATRFATRFLTYEAFGASDVQIHRWPGLPSWRTALEVS